MAKFVPQAELPVSEQAAIRREKLAALQAEGRDPFLITKFDFNADSAAIKADYEAYEGKIVKVAGRLMSKRGQGKVMFCDLQDATGRVGLGCTVVVEDANGRQSTYRITGSQEANPMQGKLSDDSPFGRAVVGKAAGETFTVNAPAGSFSMKIISVSREG